MATINSGSANPNVWIVGGKAYSDASHGGYKTNYYNAVRKLGQNLGWNVKAGSKSAQNLAAQNQKFNKAGIKTVKGNIATINNTGQTVTRNVKTGQTNTYINRGTKVLITRPNKSNSSNNSASGWNATINSWNNGWNKVGQGLSDMWNAKTGTTPAGLYHGVTEVLGGAGRIIQGLGEATIGAAFNGIAPDEAKETIGKYGQVFDVGKTLNTANKALQGELVTPWDTNNKGFIDKDWSWMGNERDRQNLQDAANGVTMILGTKGVGSGLKSVVKNTTNTISKTGKNLVKSTTRPKVSITPKQPITNSSRLLSEPQVQTIKLPNGNTITRKFSASKNGGKGTYVDFIEEASLPPKHQLALPQPKSHQQFWRGDPRKPIIPDTKAAATENARLGQTASEYARLEKLKQTHPELFEEVPNTKISTTAPVEEVTVWHNGRAYKNGEALHNPQTGYKNTFTPGSTNEFGEIWGKIGERHKQYSFGDGIIRGGESKYGWINPDEVQALVVKQGTPNNYTGPIQVMPNKYNPKTVTWEDLGITPEQVTSKYANVSPEVIARTRNWKNGYGYKNGGKLKYFI